MAIVSRKCLNTVSSCKEQIRFLFLKDYVEFCCSRLLSVSVVCVIVVVRIFIVFICLILEPVIFLIRFAKSDVT